MAADIGAFTTWSATAGSNQPDASDSIANLDDNLQTIQAEVRKYLATKGSDIASASTVNLASATGNYVHITGTTTVTALGTVSAGVRFLLVFDGALTFTHNATSLILPGGANISTAAGDRCEVVSLGSGNYRCLWYQKASGDSVVNNAQPLDATLTALAGLNSDAGLVEQTGADTFSKRAIGTASGNIPEVGTKSATESLAGLVELSNATEAPDRTKDAVVLTPATLRDALAAQNDAPIYACRAWVNFNGTGTVAIRASGNVSSITDNGTGDYTVNFTTAMPDANYCAEAFTGNEGQTEATAPKSYASDSFRFVHQRSGVGAVDATFCNVAIFR